MSHSLRVATLRLPIATSIPGNSAVYRICGASRIQPATQHSPVSNSAKSWRRAISTTRALMRDDEGETAKPKGQQQRTKSTKSVQRKVDDRPWQRVSSNAQPESTSPDPSGGDKTKGRLLTTPTRLLKLILPMPFHPEQEHINEESAVTNERPDPKDEVEPLALLVHPQQPLSYLERLIQAEIPPMKVGQREKLPNIIFRAEADFEEEPGKQDKKRPRDNVASYSGLGREGPQKKEANWVRWSGSTEVGDFIRDAARGREFAIDIEGHKQELRVAVPSFKDRTYYMRMRLRRMSREIDQMAKIKSECDSLAHQGAHRLAQGGFAALAGWWGVVYYVTFHTDAGWDLVEPVTYLAGLTTIMGGYLWFLYISKDLSYKAAMNVTVTRRQNALYQERGFDQQKWDQVVHEANALRKEIKFVASEYDEDWDEMKDLGGEEVKEVLEREDEGNKSRRKKDESSEEEVEEQEQEQHAPKKDEKSEKGQKK